MKHKLLLIIMAALALSSGAAAQTTRNRNVSKEAVRKAMQASRENKKMEEAQKEAVKTVDEGSGWGNQEKLKAADFSLCYDNVLGAPIKKLNVGIPYTVVSSTEYSGKVSGTQLRLTGDDSVTNTDAFENL